MVTLPFDAKNLPEWVQWLAQDTNGAWWGFEAEPHQANKSWYENEVGWYLRLEVGEPNSQWENSLQQRIISLILL